MFGLSGKFLSQELQSQAKSNNHMHAVSIHAEARSAITKVPTGYNIAKQSRATSAIEQPGKWT